MISLEREYAVAHLFAQAVRSELDSKAHVEIDEDIYLQHSQSWHAQILWMTHHKNIALLSIYFEQEDSIGYGNSDGYGHECLFQSNENKRKPGHMLFHFSTNKDTYEQWKSERQAVIKAFNKIVPSGTWHASERKYTTEVQVTQCLKVPSLFDLSADVCKRSVDPYKAANTLLPTILFDELMKIQWRGRR